MLSVAANPDYDQLGTNKWANLRVESEKGVFVGFVGSFYVFFTNVRNCVKIYLTNKSIELANPLNIPGEVKLFPKKDVQFQLKNLGRRHAPHEILG